VLLRRGLQAIQALLELALDPPAWRSVSELAEAQALPAPMLEQLLLKLRRSGLLEARRGRHGGYRLALPPRQIALAQVLAAVEALPSAALVEGGEPATRQVTELLETRLQRALERELAQLTLEELLFDLRSARAAQGADGGLILG
jgi:Rrf2 family protein